MLREISAIEWLEWKMWMNANPTGAEIQSILAAQIVAAIWNVQISKGAKKGTSPKLRQMKDIILRFGDMPDYAKFEGKAQTPAERFANFVSVFESWGFKAIKDHRKKT